MWNYRETHKALLEPLKPAGGGGWGPLTPSPLTMGKAVLLLLSQADLQARGEGMLGSVIITLEP